MPVDPTLEATVSHVWGTAGAGGRADLLILRRNNLSLVLRAVIRAGHVSRAEIGAITGIGQSTVSSLVDELVDRGFVTERGLARSGRAGRPRTLVGLAEDAPCTVGLEIRVTHMRACVVDLTGRVLATHVEHADNRRQPAERVVRRAAALVRAAFTQARAAGLRPRGVGVGAPGLVDPDSGLVRRSPNLGWADFDLISELSPALSPEAGPIWIDCGANLEALAELHHGSGRGYRNFVLLSGEVGIGAGVVIDGTIYRGSGGGSGEVGHLCVESGGRLCPCGSRGCLERYAGEEAVLLAAGIPNAGADPLAELVERARGGNAPALTALAQAGNYLGVGAALVSRILAPDAIILSGSLTRLAPWLTEPMARAVRESRMGSTEPVIATSALGDDAMAVGAATAGILDLVTAPDRIPRRSDGPASISTSGIDRAL